MTNPDFQDPFLLIESLIDQAMTAIDSDDYSAALKLAIKAQGRQAMLPVDIRKEGEASGSLRFREAGFQNWIENLRTMAATSPGTGTDGDSAFGIQTVKTRFINPGCGE